jgi:Flp pilus assembly protein TadD
VKDCHPNETRPRSVSVFGVCLFLIVITLAVYGQVLRFDFLNYDDNLYITGNPQVKAGLTLEGVRWAFTTGHASNWHPVTWLSHMLDSSVFGEKPAGPHLINLLLHALNACLLFLLLCRMTDDFWPSAFVAALFAIHPLHVESVAWLAERKDVLSTLFGLLTMIAYTVYVARRRAGLYLLTIVLYAIGLMAKPMLVTLPVVLLLIDFWPLRRFDAAKPFLRQAVPFVAEKLPFLVLAAASSIITFLVQQGGHSVAPVDVLPMGLRIGNAIVSYVRYILMMFWPADLTVFYPHSGPALPLSSVAVSLSVLIGLSIPISVWWRSRPYLIVGWLWYLGTLVPVIGVVQVGAQALADRYTYVPLIGLFIIVAWGLRDFGFWILDFGLASGQSLTPRSRRLILGIPAVAIVLMLSWLTAVQVGNWRDSVTLMEHALRVTSGNYLAHKNLGVALAARKQYEQAVGQYHEGIRIKPSDPDLYYNLANALDKMGKPEEAVANYQKALEINSGHAEAHYNFGNVLARQGKFEDALGQYQEVIKIDPAHQGGLVNLGNTLAMLHRPAEAMPYYLEALKLVPKNEEALTNLGNILTEQGKFDNAIKCYTRSIEINPRNKDAYGNMGFALMKLGRLDEAARAYSQVLRIDPANARARENLRIIESARSRPGFAGK